MNGYRVTLDLSIDGVRHQVDDTLLSDVDATIDRDALVQVVAHYLDNYLMHLRAEGQTFTDVQYRLRLWAHWMLN